MPNPGAQPFIVAGDNEWAWVRRDRRGIRELGGRLTTYSRMLPQKIGHPYVVFVQKNRESRKPSPQDFVRVHPNPAYRENFPIIELKDEREEYIVVAELVPALVGEFVTKTLFTAINRQGTVFFWPVRLPSPDGKDLDWWRSSREAAELAMTSWIRVRANMNLGANDIFQAESVISDPEWPQLGFWELIKIAFRDHLIDRLDHPVIKRLRGQL